MNRVPETGDEERAPLEVVQLERHNERLREALIRWGTIIALQRVT